MNELNVFLLSEWLVAFALAGVILTVYDNLLRRKARRSYGTEYGTEVVEVSSAARQPPATAGEEHTATRCEATPSAGRGAVGQDASGSPRPACSMGAQPAPPRAKGAGHPGRVDRRHRRQPEGRVPRYRVPEGAREWEGCRR